MGRKKRGERGDTGKEPITLEYARTSTDYRSPWDNVILCSAIALLLSHPLILLTQPKMSLYDYLGYLSLGFVVAAVTYFFASVSYCESKARARKFFWARIFVGVWVLSPFAVFWYATHMR